MERQDLIRLNEAADFCAVDGRTLKRWAGHDHLPIRRAHHSLLIRRKDLRRCLSNRGLPIPPELSPRPVVLVADDEPDMLSVVAWALHDLWPDSTVRTARDGDEAAKKLFELCPDLLVTDLRMPGKDGMMLCQMVQGSRELAKTKVLAFTGFDDPETRAEVFNSGAHEYLRKPFDPQELCESAMRLLGLSPAPAAEATVRYPA